MPGRDEKGVLQRFITCDTLDMGVMIMPTKMPRLNVVLEKPLYLAVVRLANRDCVSLSLKARDLIKEAIESMEDVYLTKKAVEREKTFSRKKALPHKKVWG
jgi:predicted DNA-binding protein